MIKECFSPLDAEDIINMPTGDKSAKDEIIWHLNKKGSFTVKSAYRLAMEVNCSQEASQSDISKSGCEWKSLWSLGVQPRIKVCTWKIVNDNIPSKAKHYEKNDKS